MSGYVGLYVGMVEAVYPSGTTMNSSNYQYEYRVIISGDGMATIPVKCVKSDAMGNLNDYDDATLLVGTRVYVMFPRGDMSMGVIIGGVRQFSLPTEPAKGHHWQRRFNEIVQTCDKEGAYTVRSIDGPFVKIEKKKVTISNITVVPGKDTVKPDDTEIVESIVLDSVAKTMTVTARELKIVVKDPKDAKGNITLEVSGNATVNVKKNATISVGKDVSLDVKGGAKATVAKDLNATIQGTTTIKSAKKVLIDGADAIDVKSAKKLTLKGSDIDMNQAMSPITTELSHLMVIDLITNVPVQGVKKIKAG